ncbi:hypothetical protein EDC18_101439 [Natranaerovirga pectinivora]|uniref:Uncharacterized protein n=1 Tax=Natranaerovirga pectinivora TaxID=682400 RepID=A0A4R3MPI4_9FIRM|nr:hypothetical protein [Natranaerovirga pectinivora]TCT17141.1 hypothetical protein EDC18_101439 [Natranaerovirga pectinivora]
MFNKKVKKIFLIALIILITIFSGYLLRVDRFGFSQISWEDCLQINGTKYYGGADKTLVDSADIENEIGEVKFNVSKKVNNPRYRFRNGDATFIEKGTEIYSIKNKNASVAVKIEGVYYMYIEKTLEGMKDALM